MIATSGGMAGAATACAVSSLFSMFQPSAHSTAPPATCTTGTESPKIFSTNAPNTSEPINSTNVLIAILTASICRVGTSLPWVIARNSGALPTGLTMGSSPPTTSSRTVRNTRMSSAIIMWNARGRAGPAVGALH